MIRVSKTTDLPPATVIERAAAFFGRNGVGLTEVERGECCISFSAPDGYVTLRLAEEAKARVVDVEGREYEYQIKQFLVRL